MLLTKEEYMTKWCPNSRQVAVVNYEETEGVTANRDGPDHYGVKNCNCLADGCAAWRRGVSQESVNNYHDSPAVVRSPHRGCHNYPDGWQYQYTSIDREGRKYDLLTRDGDQKVGYCGAFGKPEVA